MIFNTQPGLPTAAEALPGRSQAVPVPDVHVVLRTPMRPPFPGMEVAVFGMGCFWGAERKFWEPPGVYITAVGYAGRLHPEPDLRGGLLRPHRPHRGGAASSSTPKVTSYEELLKVFWENHDPTQGMRQGNDVGTQYRSAHLTFDRRAERPRPTPPRRVPAGAGRGRLRRDHHRDRVRRRRSTTPRTTTSSTSPRIPNGYCGLGRHPRRLPRGRGAEPLSAGPQSCARTPASSCSRM